TGCKASLIVNNNAAAVLLILTTIASGGNVIVSRGELVEIGGGFRVPEIMSASGCELIAVGTTNKTRYKDYERAINKNTKALLKVHTSNFKVVGFSETASISELSKLAKTKKIPLIEDIGSGALIDVSKYGINNEPTVTKSLKNGADIVCFSGDKLLGGPQCGIILGSKKYIDKMKSSPMYRALRVDKLTIAVLEATLRVYADPKVAELEIPILSMLAKTESELLVTAKKLQENIKQKGGNVEIVSCTSTVGGGAVPGSELKSYAIAPITNLSANKLDTKLRSLTIPIIGHIVNNKLLIDVRTLFERDYEYIVECFSELSS
ncbi:MAG: L-seryl-tRNA(Sec) selenium transferase, partial [Oscillospiraceae bacterium]|nr:L-seryl-tRNA(Sec) selenium transferase [Oscillospiraceae bacterium]